MAEITKGKWTHIEDGVICAEDGKQIASVFPRDREANANLIAAAPEMAAALKLYIAHQNGKRGHYCSECHNEIEKALAAAEGM